MTATMNADTLTDAELEALTDAEIDELVSRHDAITAMNDEMGLYGMTKDYRTYRARCRKDGVWARHLMLVGMVGERPITAPLPAIARRWNWNGNRVDLSAPDISLLVTSPELVTDRYDD